MSARMSRRTASSASASLPTMMFLRRVARYSSFRFVFGGCILYGMIISMRNLQFLETTTTTSFSSSFSSSSSSLEEEDVIASNTSSVDDGGRPLSCEKDFIVPTKMLLDHIHVAASATEETEERAGHSQYHHSHHHRPIKILCFIMTHTKNHCTRIKDVQSTWGKRCDSLLLVSDTNDTNVGTIHIPNTKSTYNKLFQKLNKTLHYIYNTHYYYNDYDWFLKVDDDSYIIMENLKLFLSQKEQQEQQDRQQLPLIYGRRFGIPIETLKRKVQDQQFINQLEQKYNYNTTSSLFIFNSGGAGYCFNKSYLNQFIKHTTTNHNKNNDNDASGPHGTVPEDVGQALVQLYHSHNNHPQNPIIPQPTRDNVGRERFHFSHPNAMYEMNHPSKSWIYRVHEHLDNGIQKGLHCCSNETISFHHMDRYPGYMQYLEHQLYTCRN